MQVSPSLDPTVQAPLLLTAPVNAGFGTVQLKVRCCGSCAPPHPPLPLPSRKCLRSLHQAPTPDVGVAQTPIPAAIQVPRMPFPRIYTAQVPIPPEARPNEYIVSIMAPRSGGGGGDGGGGSQQRPAPNGCHGMVRLELVLEGRVVWAGWTWFGHLPGLGGGLRSCRA